MAYTRDSELVREIVMASHCDDEPFTSIAEKLNFLIRSQQPDPPREWTAEDVTDEQVDVAANVMSVPKPQPAVDVERLAKAIALSPDLEVYIAVGGPDDMTGYADFTEARLVGLIADVLRRELSQPTAAESEWPADAPEWADRLVQCGDGRKWYHGCDTTTGGSSGYWTAINKLYTGPRPASWAGKPWTECVLRRP